MKKGTALMKDRMKEGEGEGGGRNRQKREIRKSAISATGRSKGQCICGIHEAASYTRFFLRGV